ncbi:repressor [Clostridioides difficile]|uniref:DUF739 family protein n=1 Tax=Clostridioides difficile TaxID=1496 RepID=UPI0006BC0139|nr:repressor [Clostridioides difficile]
MINTMKIKSRMVELGLTQRDIAIHLKLAPCTVSMKINNTRPMTLEEANKLVGVLKLNENQFGEYFFKQ